MRILSTIVQISTLAVLHVGKDQAFRSAVASQLVRHNHPRHILQTLQQPLEEALGSFGVTSFLNEDIEHNAVLVHGTPKIVLHTLDPDEYLVQVPLVPGPRPAAAQAAGKALTEFLAPAPHALLGDDDAPPRQK